MNMMLKRILPKSITDAFALSFLIFAILSIFFYEIYLTIPIISQRSIFQGILHVAFGSFLLFNIFGNLFMLITKDTSIRNLLISTKMTSNKWRFCALCEAIAPPRSFHCEVCGSCILRRDHHCIFSGCCVGYKNTRYFLLLMAYLSLGALYSSLLNIFYLWEFSRIDMYTVVSHFFPFVFLAFGQLSIVESLVNMISILPLIGFLFVLHLLLYHLRLLIHNQTTYEWGNKITCYDLGQRDNIIDCLGERFPWVWLSPFITSKQPGDGMQFATREKKAPYVEKVINR